MSVRASRPASTPGLTCTSVRSDDNCPPHVADRVLHDQKNRGAGWEFCPDSSRCFLRMPGTRKGETGVQDHPQAHHRKGARMATRAVARRKSATGETSDAARSVRVG